MDIISVNVWPTRWTTGMLSSTAENLKTPNHWGNTQQQHSQLLMNSDSVTYSYCCRRFCNRITLSIGSIRITSGWTFT